MIALEFPTHSDRASPGFVFHVLTTFSVIYLILTVWPFFSMLGLLFFNLFEVVAFYSPEHDERK